MKSKLKHISKNSKIRIGITIGDPGGIGPAITRKAVNRLAGLAEFVVIGDREVLNRAGNRHDAYTTVIDLKNVARDRFAFGQVRAEYGRAAIEYLDTAMELLNSGAIDCLVTCPISKEAVALAGFPCTGHTEYFQARTNAKNCVMMLLNDRLKISLVTRHIPLKAVAPRITRELLAGTIRATHRELQRLFAVRQPRLVACGLNPHASDNGKIGNEENSTIKPVIASLKRNGIHCAGPLSADIAIAQAYRGDYDAVIAMYHDQALIPLKVTGKNSGVNITLGLPFVRTSPLHGTAFDIAGDFKKSDPSSLIAAIQTAIQCASSPKKD